MPPGYAAFFMWVASAVLWWSGWREETAEGIPDTAVAVFLAGWPLAAWKETGLGDQMTLNGVFVWTGLAMLALLWRMSHTLRWTAFSAGILTGSLQCLMSASGRMFPDAPDWISGIGSPVLAGAAACCLVKGASAQVAAVTLALLIPECLSAVWLAGHQQVRIGSGLWMQNWWIAVLSARLLSVASAAVRFRIGLPGWRNGGQRS